MSVPDRVADKLRAEILKGTYEIGERLPPERALAEQLGVNRTSLRAALKQLEQLGLLVSRQGHGTRVLDFKRTGKLDLLAHMIPAVGGPKILHNLLEFRQILGQEAARLAAERIDDEKLEEIEQLLPDSADDETPEASLARDLEFYTLVTDASGNLVFTLLVNTVRDLVLEYGRFFALFNPPPPRVLEHHCALLAALRERDSARASQIAHDYLGEGMDRAMAQIGGGPGGQTSRKRG